MTGDSRRRPRRLTQLFAGLLLYGFSMALMVRGGLGVMPWDVLHQGVSGQAGLSLGTVVIAVEVLALLGPVDSLPVQLLMGGAGIVLNGVATAAYIGVNMGAGPRDDLMTGLVRQTGQSVGLVRTTLEVARASVAAAADRGAGPGASLRRERARVGDASLDPGFEGALGADPLGIDAQPAVQRLPAHLEGASVRPVEERVALRRIDAHHQSAPAAGRDRHVSAHEESEAAEHPHLGDRHTGQQLTDAVGQILVVGHEAMMTPA